MTRVVIVACDTSCRCRALRCERESARPVLAGVVSWLVSAVCLSRTEWGALKSIATVTALVLLVYALVVGPQVRSLLGRSALPRLTEPDQPIPDQPIPDQPPNEAADHTPLTDHS